jgi:hypothetical protein
VARIIRVERECVKRLFSIFIYAFNRLTKNAASGDEWRGDFSYSGGHANPCGGWLGCDDGGTFHLIID